MIYIVVVLIVIIAFLVYRNTKKDEKLNGELRRPFSGGGYVVGNYENGVEYGEFCEYHWNSLKRRYYYEDGKKNGDYFEYDMKGNVICKGKFINGKRVGVWEDYYSNGQIRRRYNFESNYQDNLIVIERYYEDGALEFENGIDYYPNGNIKSQLINGELHKYFESGILEYKQENRNSKNVKNRLSKELFYYENNRLKEEKIYEDTNQYEFKYLNINYFENGVIESRGEIIYNRHLSPNPNTKVGKWLFYYPNAKIKEEADYGDRCIIKRIKYQEDGKIVS